MRSEAYGAPALCWQVESLKEKLISQAQEVSRLRSELVSGLGTLGFLWGALTGETSCLAGEMIPNVVPSSWPEAM